MSRQPYVPPAPPRPRPAPADLANVALSSVEIARNAKGDTTFAVKVYDQDPDTAAGDACRIYDTLDTRFGGAE